MTREPGAMGYYISRAPLPPAAAARAANGRWLDYNLEGSYQTSEPHRYLRIHVQPTLSSGLRDPSHATEKPRNDGEVVSCRGEKRGAKHSPKI